MQARAFLHDFFGWYNEVHHHVGVALMTPNAVHYGEAEAIAGHRQEVLESPFAQCKDLTRRRVKRWRHG